MPSPTRSIRAPKPFWDSLYAAAEMEGTEPNTLLKRIVTEALTPRVIDPPTLSPAPAQPAPALLPRFMR